MIPSKNVTKTIGGIIARYQELLSIEIFAYVVLSNHPHLLVRAPRSNLDEFEENVNREIARRMNWKHHRSGKFWARRYDDQEILTDDDLLEAFLYINTNPVKHGLVEDARDWPGLSSIEHALTGKDRRFSFIHYSAEGGPRSTSHTLKLSLLPEFAELDQTERRTKIENLLFERTEVLKEERRANGQGFLGIEKVLSQIPGDLPVTVSRSRRPLCYSKSAEARREFRRRDAERRARYADASFRFRLGDYTVTFPAYTFKPPLHRRPRSAPFTALSDDFLTKAS